MDEARFGRMSQACRCWAPMGFRPLIPQQLIREFIYVYAAVSPFDGDIDALVLPEVSAEAMSVFLKEVSDRHPDKHIVMIMDQAGWHRAKKLVIPDNITLFWLPPYSPELNPVEHLWDEIREKWFNNYAFKSLCDVEKQLVKALKHLIDSPELIKSMTFFKWMRLDY